MNLKPLDKEALYTDIIKLLTPLVSRCGIVTTDDAWALCKERASYSLITKFFREIMTHMQAKNMATKMRRGQWRITSSGYKINAGCTVDRKKLKVNLYEFLEGAVPSNPCVEIVKQLKTVPPNEFDKRALELCVAAGVSVLTLVKYIKRNL